MSLKGLFIISAIATIIGSLLIILLGVYEIYLNQMDHHEAGKTIVVTHLFVSQVIFCSCNIMILFHVLYITQYVLRGLRYHWHVSWHYFTYVTLEIVSMVCIIGKYEYLHYPLILHIMTGVLCGLLFFFNCWAVYLFHNIDEKIKERKEMIAEEPSIKNRNVPCVRIDLKSSTTGPGTSGVTAKPSNISRKSVSK